MADAPQTQETGGGEAPPAPEPQEAKPTEGSAEPQEVKPVEPKAPEQTEAQKEPVATPDKLKETKTEATTPAELPAVLAQSPSAGFVTASTIPVAAVPVSEPSISAAPASVLPASGEISIPTEPAPSVALVASAPICAAPVSETPAAASSSVAAAPASDVSASSSPASDAVISATPAPQAPISAAPPVPIGEVPSATTDQNANNVEQAPVAAASNWQQRELELLKKIEELEKVNRTEKGEDGLKLELKVREDEIDLLKARVRNLETELHAALSKPNGKNHEMIENIKQQHEELLSKARGMIFDKTKMVKNQELQIEALTTQVQSLKDINLITKDLLEIRNSEVKAMEDRLQAMEARFKAEKERFGLVLQRAQTSTNLNDDLKKEYETQLAIFKELRAKYELKVQALVAENEKLKAQVNTGASGPSGQ